MVKRAVNLKFVPEAIEVPKPDKNGQPQWEDGNLLMQKEGFSWAKTLRDMVKGGLPNNGRLNAAQVIELIEVWDVLKDAQDGEMLVMEDSTHKLLMSHLDRLAWSGFNPFLAEMLHDLREAPEWLPPALEVEA